MRRLLSLVFVLSVLGTTPSMAGRTCRVLFLSAPDNAPTKLQLFDGKASQEVELPQMNLSPVYKLPEGELVIRLLATAPLKPEEVSPDAPKAAIPPTMTDFYLLVSSDPSNKIVPVKLQVIDADATKFRPGQMLWFNLTPNSVGGQVGTEQLAMAANSKAIVNAPASKNEDYNVNLSFRMPGNEVLYPLCETKWRHDTRSRSILFVIPQQGSRSPKVLGFPDFREPEKKEGQP